MKLLIELLLVRFIIVFLLFFSLRLVNALEHLVKMRGERQIQGKCSDMYRNAHNTSNNFNEQEKVFVLVFETVFNPNTTGPLTLPLSFCTEQKIQP